MNDLTTIVDLSHAFGSTDYVKGGGGNTSVKDDTTLWVKPSGTTLAGLTPDTFVAMSRAGINALYGVTPPTTPDAREALVKNMMADAVENDAGRPSVEAPLHNAFEATYVVHTHPALVNGMTCARDGEATCHRLFPDALWVEYIDPGYTLCMEVRDRMAQWRREQGHDPALLVLKNHGIFIAVDTLRTEYAAAAIGTTLAIAPAPPVCDDTERTIRALFGEDAAFLASSGPFRVAPGPITPDHLVYAKAFAFTDALTPEAVARYRAERGYAPKVIVTSEHVYGIGTSRKNADLALEFAADGALLLQLAEAFGGIIYMSDAHREFIENWEVESYRAKQA